MKILAVALFLSLGLFGPAHAQEPDVKATIGAQIDAFLQDDFAQAFTFASPNIQRIFRSPENFGAMVKRGYPMVWRPHSVEYLDQREDGGLVVQNVQVTDQKGNVHVLEYYMVRTEKGWKINGVNILESSAVAA